MPIPGILSTARSLSFYLKLQEVTANNLANANTEGFKADRLTAHALPGSTHAIPVEATDLQQGAVRDTGRPLDVALEGKGFLVVSTPNGERLHRGGSLRLDAAGRLTTADGDLVLGEDGPVVLQGADIHIQGDGTVLADDTIAARLRIEDVKDPLALKKEGGNRYVAEAARPVEPGTVQVRQGAIEDANLDPVLSMVDLVAIQRAYSANIDALRALDSVLGTITNEVGKV